MFRFLDSLKSKPKNKFSLENLQYLYNVLIKNPTINEQNKGLIVETLRQIAEVMIWGDQHSPDFFDFFAEKNIIGYFLKILNQKGSREVHVQLIQTLSILLENTKNQHSIYYILSNNHINELITHKFDFSDDELLAYYISFLKALSLKLNSSTIQFFFNERANDFPLYTEAIKFFNHKEAMIRIAVRTLTLNVYKVEDDAMRRYILDKAAAPYFSNIVWYIRDQCSSLDTMVINVNASMDYYSKAKLEDFVAELLDYFYYLHDIFNQRIGMMSEVLCIHMLECLLLPQFVKSLIPKREQEHLSQDEDIVNIAHIPPEYSDLDDHISPVLAVYCLSCVFYIFSFSKLVNTLAARILHPSSEDYLNTFYHTHPASDNKERVFLALPTIPLKHKFRKIQSDSNLLSMAAHKLASPQNSNADKQSSESSGKTDSVSTKYYSKLLSLLESDDRTVLGVAALLYAIIKSPGIDQSLLEISGLCPFKLTKAKRLLEALTSDDQTDPNNNNQDVVSDTNITLEENLTNPVKDKSIHNRSASDGLLRLPSENIFLSPIPSRALLIDSLLQILLKSSSFRVVTVQLVSMILKELVFIPDEPANLTDKQKGMLQEAYDKSVQTLKSCLSGNLSGIFLELFENEVRSARALNFDQLMTDCILFLLPVPDSSLSGVNLSKRLPGTDTEKMQKSIQEFLVIRELKFTLSNIVDSFLPLKADPVPPVKVKDHLILNGNTLREAATEDNDTNLEANNNYQAESSTTTNVVGCWVLVGSGVTRKKLKRIIYLHQEAPFISILEPDPRALADTQSFVVSQVVPLQNLEISRESSMDEEYGFQMICHPITWSATFSFDDLPTCTEVLRLLEQAKLKARSEKTRHIENILNS